VTVEAKTIALTHDGQAKLNSFPQAITFNFGPKAGTEHDWVRLRHKLEGYEDKWSEQPGEMAFSVRFFDESGDQISQNIFRIIGESAGWNGSLNSPLTHRRESLVVPARASRLWIVLSSAGPPASVGIFVVSDLAVSRLASSNHLEVVMRFPFEAKQADELADPPPQGWIRDGTHPSMAKIIELGQNPVTRAFAILDDDPNGHAEWHNIKEFAPEVRPGDHLVIEWNEMFSLGMGNTRTVNYSSLPAGNFRFRVAATTLMGVATGVEASLGVFVPPPFWNEPWFWTTATVLVVLAIVVVSRYVVRYRLRKEVARLEQQRVLEQERLRIAHDIHDDLGARVTQISLFSAMAQNNQAFPAKARENFDQISRMSRELVSALYETVWAVNPENDNLDALGNFLCQMVNQLCDQRQLRCRLHVVELPSDVQISSATRHNVTMAVKEAVHNVIKHAKATELTVRIELSGRLLTVVVQDDGCGFDPGAESVGNGLTNMKRRLENIGGTCRVQSEPGKGTKVNLGLALKSPIEGAPPSGSKSNQL
jgi:signal transduction histidine kinase